MEFCDRDNQTCLENDSPSRGRKPSGSLNIALAIAIRWFRK